MWQGLFPDRSLLTVHEDGQLEAYEGEAMAALIEWEAGRVPLNVGTIEKVDLRHVNEHLRAAGAEPVNGPPDEPYAIEGVEF